MPDYNPLIADINGALDKAHVLAGTPNPAAQIATLIGERDVALAALTPLQQKIAAAGVAAQAEKDADASSVAGQGVLTALGL